MSYLADDIARCPGVKADGIWREGCEDCRRRTSPAKGFYVPHMAPPEIIVFECEYRIPPEKEPNGT